MEKSRHNNYIKGFDRNWPLLVKNQIIPNEKNIFDLFSQKFARDAEADLNRGRKKLGERGNICANSCHEIHTILSGDMENNPELKTLVENIVNLDYESLGEVFSEIKKSYLIKGENSEIEKYLQKIYEHIEKMRQVSKKRTNVITK